MSTSTLRSPMTTAVAEAVYDILTHHLGASEKRRTEFNHIQTSGHADEYRLVSDLGPTAKFRRDRGPRPDGTWGARWYVEMEPGTPTVSDRAAMDRANTALVALAK